MRTTDADDGPVVFELTVAGAMGAVFRAAVRPHEVSRSEVCTVFRAGTAQDMDVAELVRRLHEHGFSVEGVIAL